MLIFASNVVVGRSRRRSHLDPQCGREPMPIVPTCSIGNPSASLVPTVGLRGLWRTRYAPGMAYQSRAAELSRMPRRELHQAFCQGLSSIDGLSWLASNYTNLYHTILNPGRKHRMNDTYVDNLQTLTPYNQVLGWRLQRGLNMSDESSIASQLLSTHRLKRGTQICPTNAEEPCASCGLWFSSIALSEILLLIQSSPFPILRDQSLLAPEYHREYGRGRGFNPRKVSWVHSGLAWRRLRGQSAWTTSCLPLSRPPRSTGFRREWACVDANHNATGFLLGTWRVNATRYMWPAIGYDTRASLQPKAVYGSAAFRPILFGLRDWGSCITDHASLPSA